jgi:hypothetical protein
VIKQLVSCLALVAFVATATSSLAAPVTIEDVISPTSIVLTGASTRKVATLTGNRSSIAAWKHSQNGLRRWLASVCRAHTGPV